MSDDDLKRLITQYERYMAGLKIDFDEGDIIEALRELLLVKGVISEMKDLIDNCQH